MFANVLLMLVDALLFFAGAFLMFVSVCKNLLGRETLFAIPHATVSDNFNGKLEDTSAPA